MCDLRTLGDGAFRFEFKRSAMSQLALGKTASYHLLFRANSDRWHRLAVT